MKRAPYHWMIGSLLMFVCSGWITNAEESIGVSRALRVVLDHAKPLEQPRGDRLPLFAWPIHHALHGIPDAESRVLLTELNRRGIAYCVNWNPNDFEASLAEGLRIARLQRELGMEICVNANACLYSLFDGTEATAHIDGNGQPYWDTSFGPKTGCPFALDHRIPIIRERIQRYVEAYGQAGAGIDFIFADWEIDGPMEWNDAWIHSQRCARCMRELPEETDFRAFQTVIRKLRSDMQKRMFSEPVLARFPDALVGNYAVHPHDGYRYWFDYFEQLPNDAPVIKEHGMRYREWAPEFEASGYTMGMPVVYTWYPIYESLPFEPSDYRWFYNLLKVGSNAGAHTPAETPSVPFVHWHTTAPPEKPSEQVRQFSEESYKDLLWHLLLRGHDTFFLWCMEKEIAKEIALVHQVYAASMDYSEYIRNGTPIEQTVPGVPGAVVSGMRLQDKVLVKRTQFGDQNASVLLRLSEREVVEIPAHFDLGILPVRRSTRERGWAETAFPIGFYEHPEDEDELRKMALAGINLVRCGNRSDLDRVDAVGLKGWISLPVHEGLTEHLQTLASTLWDHPALAVWEGPDEIVWTFTAYSFLKKRAGFTRADWENQDPIATQYAESIGPNLLYRMRQGIEWLKRNDPHRRPFWINEAADSDAHYSRGYVEHIDILGCDYYAVRSTGTDLHSIGRLVERWDAIGRQRPVWMVLQGFSWHTVREDRERLYPSFTQSRFMAYDAIVHGARGLLYWGTNTIDDPGFRQSLYALTSEIAGIAAFLNQEFKKPVGAKVIPDLFEPRGSGIKALHSFNGREALLILVNKDPYRHLAVEVAGLVGLDGKRLHLLYGNEMQIPKDGRFITRIQSEEVKIFATDPTLAKGIREGRNYAEPPNHR